MTQKEQESAWLYEVWAWLEVNRKRVIVGAVGALVVVVIGYVLFWKRGQTELNADDALLSLRPTAAASGAKPAASPEDFLKVAAEHASTAAAERALLLAAGRFYDEGKYAEAQAQYEKALGHDASGLLAPLAALGVATSLDAQDKVDAAMAAYQAVVSKYPDSPAAADAKMAMAFLHESRNEPEQALKLYDEVAANRAAGRTAMEASTKREELLKVHPELAKTNTPVALPAAIPAVTNSATTTNTAAATNTTAAVATNAPAAGH